MFKKPFRERGPNPHLPRPTTLLGAALAHHHGQEHPPFCHKVRSRAIHFPELAGGLAPRGFSIWLKEEAIVRSCQQVHPARKRRKWAGTMGRAVMHALGAGGRPSLRQSVTCAHVRSIVNTEGML